MYVCLCEVPFFPSVCSPGASLCNQPASQAARQAARQDRRASDSLNRLKAPVDSVWNQIWMFSEATRMGANTSRLCRTGLFGFLDRQTGSYWKCNGRKVTSLTEPERRRVNCLRELTLNLYTAVCLYTKWDKHVYFCGKNVDICLKQQQVLSNTSRWNLQAHLQLLNKAIELFP